MPTLLQMKKMFRYSLERIETKLFPISLGFLFCSILLGIVTRFYEKFIFKFQFHRSLSPSEQQEWWHKLINLEQASEFFRTPLTLFLLTSAIVTALVGFLLMSISIRMDNKATERGSSQIREQLLKENLPNKTRKA